MRAAIVKWWDGYGVRTTRIDYYGLSMLENSMNACGVNTYALISIEFVAA